MSCGQRPDRHTRNRERYDELYFNEDVWGWNGIFGCFEKSAGTRLCGSRSDGGRRRSWRRKEDGDHGFYCISFKSRVCGCVYGRNYKNYGGRYRLCQRVWQRDQAAWCHKACGWQDRGQGPPDADPGAAPVSDSPWLLQRGVCTRRGLRWRDVHGTRCRKDADGQRCHGWYHYCHEKYRPR